MSQKTRQGNMLKDNHQHRLQNQIDSERRQLCVWWDQNGVVYYELCKAGETVSTNRYRQQMSHTLIKN